MTDLNDIIETPENTEKTNSLDMFSKLFESEEIELKTELTTNQVVELNKKRAVANLLDWDSLNYVLNDFMILMVSKERGGRKEFIEGLKTEREKEHKETGFFQNLKSKFGME